MRHDERTRALRVIEMDGERGIKPCTVCRDGMEQRRYLCPNLLDESESTAVKHDSSAGLCYINFPSLRPSLLKVEGRRDQGLATGLAGESNKPPLNEVRDMISYP